MKRYIVFIYLLFFSIFGNTQSQLTNFLQSGIDDGETLLSEYFQPYGKAIGTSLNGGWINSAKTHNVLGFDLTLTITTSIIPEVDKTFDINNLTLQKFELYDPTDNIAPSIAGDNTNGPLLVYTEPHPVTGQPVEIASINTPSGTGVPYLPFPMIKAAIGLPLGFEIMGRYAPPVSILDDYEISLWGIGVKHDLKQYIPFLKHAPVVNFSAMAAYTKFISTGSLNLSPYGHPVILTNIDFDNQKLGLSANGLSGNLLLSINLPVISFYGGVGFSETVTNLEMTGNYPFSTIETDPNSQYFGLVVLRDQDVITDPIDIEIMGRDGMRYMGGVRLKIALITFHADYTYADYHVISAGLGISFR